MAHAALKGLEALASRSYHNLLVFLGDNLSIKYSFFNTGAGANSLVG